MASDRSVKFPTVLLTVVGVALLGLCVFVAVRQQDVLAGGLGILALGAFTLAALMPRLTGPVEMSLTGFKVQLSQLSEVGKKAGYTDTEILSAINRKLDHEEVEAERSSTDERRSSPDLVSGSPQDPEAGGGSADEKFKLATMLHVKYLSSRAQADLEEARIVAEDALAACSLFTPIRPAVLNVLGVILADESDLTNNPVSLDRAIALQRRALSSSPASSHTYAVALKELARLLHRRYERLGDVLDLDQSIAFLRELESARRKP